jgi:hypothetical protein
MSMPLTGTCLCGAVRFEITGGFQHFFLCHCSRCRKATGSAHAANLFSRTASLTWLMGEDLVRRYRVPDSRNEKCFCSQCGSPLPNARPDQGLLMVPAGSLDSRIDLRPEAHIHMASKAAWDRDLERVPLLDGSPS